MCGIAGALDRGGLPADQLASHAEALGDAVAHRGPDSRGTWTDPGAGIALAHTRLAILDLSPAGHQPMVSASGRFVLTFNGEIYNFDTIRQDLAAAGTQFQGSGDTEVLIAAVDAWGLDRTLRRLNGMFALALWDRHDKTLTLARDRLGEKPLYYGPAGSALVFGSELGALRAYPGFDSRLSRDALAAYVRLSYVPAPLSIYQNVHKVPVGSYVVVDSTGAVGEPVAYWSIEDAAAKGLADPLDVDDETAIDLVETCLQTSVRQRLASDVPLGAFLSGGVDSSLVTALMQTVSSSPVRTYTVAVGGRSGDESAAAAAVARHLGTEHTTLALSDADALTSVPHVARLYDEPFGDPSQVPVALMCAAAREHVTVCVSGDGGDEVFAGYNRYLLAHGALGRVHRLPAPLRSIVGSGLAKVPTTAWGRLNDAAPRLPSDLATKMAKLASTLSAGDVTEAQRRLAEHWDPAEVLLEEAPGVSPPGTSRGSLLDSMMLADQRTTLPDDMLAKVDRASMAVALEVRVPLLDHELVELAWRLPRRMKVRGGRGKWVLREALYRHVPRALVDRPKQGFDPPLAEWLRGPLREWAEDLLSPARLTRQGLFAVDPVRRRLEAHLAGQPGHDYALWLLLMAQSWIESRELETVA